MNLMTLLLLAVACPQEDPDELTPARTMELLQEAHRLMGKAEDLLNEGRRLPEAEKREKDAADKLAEVIRKAKSSAGQSGQQSRGQEQGQSKGREAARAKDAYDPKRADEPSKFQSSATKSGSWGRLPPDVRRALLAMSREEVPVRFQELWRKYVELLEETR